jgi:acetyl-CoA synthetase
MTVDVHPEDAQTFPIIDAVAKNAHVKGMAAYEALYKQSIEDPDTFWAKAARENLSWFHDFDQTLSGSLAKGDIAWFTNGKLNVSHNCIDRHIPTRGDKTAIIWEADEPGHSKHITYKELLQETCRVANAMKAQGVKKGDTVAVYMPMIPELVYVMLACTRIGAIHSVVFAGFSSDSLRDRIVDAKSKWVFTSDEGKRGGRTLPLKEIVDHAVHGLEFVRRVFVFKRTNNQFVTYNKHLDIDMSAELSKHRPYCAPEWMDSEDLLFVLYTSGSTGTPKGVAHTTAGYLLYTMLTTKYTFDLHDDDIHACVADCGWITGHSYIVYGPLANGTTTVMFESTPVYPDPGRYWELVQRHKITTFYTAPTAIRALMAHGDEYVKKYDRSTLRILGSVGEPINPEAWRWYYNVVGEGKCYVTDTYWQTETGGHVGVGLSGVTPMKPGSCTKPFFGIDFVLTDDKGTIYESVEAEGELCIRRPWPGMARTVFGDHNRYLAVYMASHKGLYFTGDGAKRDKDGYLFITGRIDGTLMLEVVQRRNVGANDCLMLCRCANDIGSPYRDGGNRERACGAQPRCGGRRHRVRPSSRPAFGPLGQLCSCFFISQHSAQDQGRGHLLLCHAHRGRAAVGRGQEGAHPPDPPRDRRVCDARRDCLCPRIAQGKEGLFSSSRSC